MTFTLRINARNDLHLPAEVLRRLNLGDEKIMTAEIKNNSLVLVPVDLEPRVTHRELDALDRLHVEEKKKGLTRIRSEKDLDRLGR
jgi:antitoxin component of MazEF toxin-antitoxin module